jgi:hypothetical protein
LLAVCLGAVCYACGGSSERPASGTVDLATADTLLSITYPAGDADPGAPASIASGDFNGDGKTDLLLGAPLNDGPDGKRPDAGEAYVLYGPLDGNIDLSERKPDVRILGAETGDNLGAGVAVGDLNGDGVDDIIVGAPFSNGIPEQRTDMGEAYVVFGGPSIATTIDTLAAQQNAGLLPAEGFSHLGRTFAVADVNGDGIDDLIAGAPYAGRQANTPPGGQRTTVGEVYVVFGSRQLKGQVRVARDEEDVRLSGIAVSDQFGDSVAAADVNGDGVADVIVGASGYDAPDRTDAGGTFVFYGGASLPSVATLREADVTITGARADDGFGALVAAGDVNGDGKAEVIASAPAASGASTARRSVGEVDIVEVAKAVGGAIDLATAGTVVRMLGPAANEFAPSSLGLSGGGTPRIAFGASVFSSLTDRSAAGATYLVPARTGGEVDLAQPASGVTTLLGAVAGDGLGAAVAFADLDGDGSPELLTLAAGTVTAGGGADPGYRARLYGVRLP